MGNQVGQPGTLSSAVDGYTSGVVGHFDISTLGISTDMLLFSDIHLSLVHHYRIHKRGLPHVAFRRNYLSELRALLPLQVAQPADGVVSPDSSSSGSLHPAESPEVMEKSPRTTRHAYRWRRPVHVMEPSLENIPVLTIQDPSAAAWAVVLGCRPPLLPVSMDISGVDLSAGRLPAVSAGVDVLPNERGTSFSRGDLIGLICPELGVAPLVDPGTDLEDELLTPVGSPSTDISKSVPTSTSSGVDLELARALMEIGVLPVMVTPIVDPEVGSSMTPAEYPVPPIPELSVVDSVPLEVASPARPTGGSPARNESLLCQVSPPGSIAEAVPSPTSPVLRSTDVDSPPSGLAAMDQYLSWSASPPVGETADSPLLPAPLTPRRIVEEQFVPGSVVASPTGETDVAGGHTRMPDLSREGPFDVHLDRSTSGAFPRVLDGMRGCQYRMTSYDEENGGPDFSPAYGIQLHDPRLLEYVGAPESARLLSRSSEYWLHHLGHEKRFAAALQLQHDAGLILSNVQVLQQFVTSLNRTSSEVMRVVFGREPFPVDAMQQVVSSFRVRWAAHYMATMGLWRPPSTQGIRGPLPSATCNACMSCSDCFPDLPQVVPLVVIRDARPKSVIGRRIPPVHRKDQKSSR